jgi:hypothetical protein
MPTIGAAVDEATKGRFELIAKARRTTASRLAASLIIDFLSREDANAGTLPQAGLPCTGPPDARGGTKSETVYVRLEPYYFAELGQLAQKRNWYRATYLANLFYAHADRRPVLCDAEIDAVRQVARQLAHLGRNINQIAKVVNAAPDMAQLPPPADLEVVRMLIDLETTVVKELLTANLRGWGVSDGKA